MKKVIAAIKAKYSQWKYSRLARRNISELQKRIKQLEERVPSENTKYIELNAFSDTDTSYIHDLARIAVDPAFRFFLYDSREKMIDALESTKATEVERRGELIGEIKAIGIMRKNLEHVVALSEGGKEGVNG